MSRKTKAAREHSKKVRAIHGREFVEMLDSLIKLRVLQHASALSPFSRDPDEDAEVLKRQMADYLNDIDQTGGVMAG